MDIPRKTTQPISDGDLKKYYELHVAESNLMAHNQLEAARAFIRKTWAERDRMRYSLGWKKPFLVIELPDGSIWDVLWEEVVAKIAIIQIGTKDEGELKALIQQYHYQFSASSTLSSEFLSVITWEELLEVGLLQTRLAKPPYESWWLGGVETRPKVTLMYGKDIPAEKE